MAQDPQQGTAALTATRYGIASLVGAGLIVAIWPLFTVTFAVLYVALALAMASILSGMAAVIKGLRGRNWTALVAGVLGILLAGTLIGWGAWSFTHF